MLWQVPLAKTYGIVEILLILLPISYSFVGWYLSNKLNKWRLFLSSQMCLLLLVQGRKSPLTSNQDTFLLSRWREGNEKECSAHFFLWFGHTKLGWSDQDSCWISFERGSFSLQSSRVSQNCSSEHPSFDTSFLQPQPKPIPGAFQAYTTHLHVVWSFFTLWIYGWS